jgi:hypothetical protein
VALPSTSRASGAVTATPTVAAARRPPRRSRPRPAARPASGRSAPRPSSSTPGGRWRPACRPILRPPPAPTSPASGRCSGLSQEQVDSLEVVAVNPLGKGAAVLLRQVFGDLRTATTGLVSVGVVDGPSCRSTSSLTRGHGAAAGRTLTRRRPSSRPRDAGRLGEPSTAELVALPVPEGARSACRS